MAEEKINAIINIEYEFPDNKKDKEISTLIEKNDKWESIWSQIKESTGEEESSFVPVQKMNTGEKLKIKKEDFILGENDKDQKDVQINLIMRLNKYQEIIVKVPFEPNPQWARTEHVEEIPKNLLLMKKVYLKMKIFDTVEDVLEKLDEYKDRYLMEEIESFKEMFIYATLEGDEEPYLYKNDSLLFEITNLIIGDVIELIVVKKDTDKDSIINLDFSNEKLVVTETTQPVVENDECFEIPLQLKEPFKMLIKVRDRVREEEKHFKLCIEKSLKTKRYTWQKNILNRVRSFFSLYTERLILVDNNGDIIRLDKLIWDSVPENFEEEVFVVSVEVTEEKVYNFSVQDGSRKRSVDLFETEPLMEVLRQIRREDFDAKDYEFIKKHGKKEVLCDLTKTFFENEMNISSEKFIIRPS